MKPRVAINGLGRIGRSFLKIALEKNLNIIAINDLTEPETLAYLLKYDSVYGVYDKKVEAEKDFIKVNNNKIRIFSEKEPLVLPWKQLDIDIVVESTGAFREREKAEKHLKAGAKKVLITAVAKNPDITVILGVNDNNLKKEHKIISNASCTTNCLAPVAKILNDKFGIKKGFMTTVHGYTTSQNLLDGPNKKLRRGRAAAVNIVPTTSGATTATIEVIPELRGKLDGIALRVPIICGSVLDFVAELNKKASVEQINNAFKQASETNMKGIIEYTEDEIVSSDIIRNPHSSIVDSLLTQVLGDTVKIIAWYDNEFGYSNRVVELIKILKF